MIPPTLAPPNRALPMYGPVNGGSKCVVCGRTTPSPICGACSQWAARLLGMLP